MSAWCMLLGAGAAAGTVGGMLGIGGGVVLMPVLRYGFGFSAAEAAGTCVVGVLGTTMGGALSHWRLGHLVWSSLWPAIIAGALCTATVSLFFPSFALKAGWIDLGVGLVFVFVTGRMVVEPFCKRAAEGASDYGALPGSTAQKAIVGGLAGIFPGLLGIGAGSILVPAFSLVLKAPLRTAMAASLACFATNAGISAGFKLFQGFVDPTAAGATLLGAAVGAWLGARLQERVASNALRLMFCGVFALVALRFLRSAWETMTCPF